MPKPGRYWVALDLNFFEENADYPDEALLLFIRMMIFCKRTRSEGQISLGQALRLDRDAENLLAGLCAPRPGTDESLVVASDEADLFLLRGWQAWNGQADSRSALSKARAEAGRKGGLAKAAATQQKFGVANDLANEKQVAREPVVPRVIRDLEDASNEASAGKDLTGFEDFWAAYPRRHGRVVGRGKSEEIWAKLSIEVRRLMWRAVVNYRREVDAGMTLAKDPERWMRGDVWRDWLSPLEAAPGFVPPIPPSSNGLEFDPDVQGVLG